MDKVIDTLNLREGTGRSLLTWAPGSTLVFPLEVHPRGAAQVCAVLTPEELGYSGPSWGTLSWQKGKGLGPGPVPVLVVSLVFEDTFLL